MLSVYVTGLRYTLTVYATVDTTTVYDTLQYTIHVGIPYVGIRYRTVYVYHRPTETKAYQLSLVYVGRYTCRDYSCRYPYMPQQYAHCANRRFYSIQYIQRYTLSVDLLGIRSVYVSEDA